MKFGKFLDISDVDFSLLVDVLGNVQCLFVLFVNGVVLQFYIGCIGWSMKEWVGSVYFKGIKVKDYFKVYSLQFNIIEFNIIYYCIFNVQIIDKWYWEFMVDFWFCLKVL